MTNDLEHSIIAQLIEVGLLARFGDRDPEGAKQAREAVRAELLANGWSLPPYTDTAHDFRHAAMHRMADWPILAQLVAAKKSAALRLDSRTVAALYADAGEDDWAAMSAGESEFATAAINAHPAPPYTQEDRQEDAELNDLADARQGSPEIRVSLDDLE